MTDYSKSKNFFVQQEEEREREKRPSIKKREVSSREVTSKTNSSEPKVSSKQLSRLNSQKDNKKELSKVTETWSPTLKVGSKSDINALIPTKDVKKPKEKEKEKEREQDKEREKDKERDREKERDKDKDKERDVLKEREERRERRERDKERGRDKEKIREHEKDKKIMVTLKEKRSKTSGVTSPVVSPTHSPRPSPPASPHTPKRLDSCSTKENLSSSQNLVEIEIGATIATTTPTVSFPITPQTDTLPAPDSRLSRSRSSSASASRSSLFPQGFQRTQAPGKKRPSPPSSPGSTGSPTIPRKGSRSRPTSPIKTSTTAPSGETLPTAPSPSPSPPPPSSVSPLPSPSPLPQTQSYGPPSRPPPAPPSKLTRKPSFGSSSSPSLTSAQITHAHAHAPTLKKTPNNILARSLSPVPVHSKLIPSQPEVPIQATAATAAITHSHTPSTIPSFPQTEAYPVELRTKTTAPEKARLLVARSQLFEIETLDSIIASLREVSKQLATISMMHISYHKITRLKNNKGFILGKEQPPQPPQSDSLASPRGDQNSSGPEEIDKLVLPAKELLDIVIQAAVIRQFQASSINLSFKEKLNGAPENGSTISVNLNQNSTSTTTHTKSNTLPNSFNPSTMDKIDSQPSSSSSSTSSTSPSSSNKPPTDLSSQKRSTQRPTTPTPTSSHQYIDKRNTPVSAAASSTMAILSAARGAKTVRRPPPKTRPPPTPQPGDKEPRTSLYINMVSAGHSGSSPYSSGTLPPPSHSNSNSNSNNSTSPVPPSAHSTNPNANHNLPATQEKPAFVGNRVKSMTISASQYHTKLISEGTPKENAIRMVKELKSRRPFGPDVESLNYVLTVLESSDNFRPTIKQIQEGGGALNGEIKRWIFSELFHSSNSTSSLITPRSRSSIIDDDILFSKINPEIDDVIRNLLSKLEEWDFNVFQISEITNQKPLSFVSYTIFKKMNFFSKYSIRESTMRDFLKRIESGYNTSFNPYHNATHAADVTHAIYHFIQNPVLCSYFTELELFSAIVAGIIHDYDHPGLNNSFHIQNGDPKAIIYNDRSVLENYHIAAAWKIITQKDTNILCSLTRQEYMEVRDTIISMVLATDMSSHFEILGQFKVKLAGNGFDPSNREDRKLLLKMVIKCADISNPTKRQELAYKWTESVMDEFFLQGDKERELGIKISPFMDREKTSVPVCQISFIDFLVMPLFQAWSSFLGTNLYVDNIQNNRTFWLSKQ